MRFLARLVINAAALWVATRIVPGIRPRLPWRARRDGGELRAVDVVRAAEAWTAGCYS